MYARIKRSSCLGSRRLQRLKTEEERKNQRCAARSFHTTTHMHTYVCTLNAVSGPVNWTSEYTAKKITIMIIITMKKKSVECAMCFGFMQVFVNVCECYFSLCIHIHEIKNWELKHRWIRPTKKVLEARTREREREEQQLRLRCEHRSEAVSISKNIAQNFIPVCGSVAFNSLLCASIWILSCLYMFHHTFTLIYTFTVLFVFLDDDRCFASAVLFFFDYYVCSFA